MGFYKPLNTAKTLVPLAILLLIAFSVWRLHHTHSSIAKLAQLDRHATAGPSLCPPCTAQISAAAAAAAATGGLPCKAANSGGVDSSSIDRLVGGAPQAAAGLGPVPDSSSDSGTSRATGTPTENGASMDGRDWVFSGGVGAEEAAAPANAILDTGSFRQNTLEGVGAEEAAAPGLCESGTECSVGCGNRRGGRTSERNLGHSVGVGAEDAAAPLNVISGTEYSVGAWGQKKLPKRQLGSWGKGEGQS
eukprot:333246-Pelagomonas_calceolata.AAC.9